MKTGVVFGVFDGLHEGHRSMLRVAHASVDRLVAIIPSDAVVVSLKRKVPKYAWEARKSALLAQKLVEDVKIGDETMGEYHVLSDIHPDVIFLGYDQEPLRVDLERHMRSTGVFYPLHVLPPHSPDRYKSSLLNSYD